MYHEGKLPDPSTPRPTEYDECEFLLDNKPTKIPSRSAKKKASLDHEQYSSPTASYPGCNEDLNQLGLFDAYNLQYPSPHNTGLLFPPKNNGIYYGGSSVLSQSVYSSSASPYSTGQHYGHEDPAVTDTSINYQLYPDNYGYPEPQAPVYNNSDQYHYTTPDPYYGYSSDAIFNDPSTCHPLDTQDSNQNGFNDDYLTAPALLTTPFYYQ